MEDTYTSAEPWTEPDEEESRGGVTGARIVALITVLLTIGGLFIGLLGKAVAAFTPTYYGAPGQVLGWTLLGWCITTLKLAFTNTPAEAAAGITGGAESKVAMIMQIALIALLAAAVIVSVVTFVLTLVKRESAEKAASVGCSVSLAAYGLLFFWSFAMQCFATILSHLLVSDASVSIGLTKEAFDLSVIVILGALLLTAAIYAIARKKLIGFLNLLLLIFAGAAIFAFVYPSSFTASTLLAPFELFQSQASGVFFYGLMQLAVAAILLVCLLVSIFRLGSDTAPVLEAILYALQLLLVLVLALAACLTGGSGWSWAFFGDGTLLPSLLLIIAPLGALLLSLVRLLVLRNRAAAEEEDADAYDYDFDDEEEPEVLAEEPEETPAPVIEPEPLVAAVEDFEPAPEPEPEPEPEELSDFERAMLASAESGTPDTASAPAPEPEPQPQYPPQPQYQPQPQYPPQPTYTPYGRQPYPPQPPVPAYDYGGSQYTYDPFITTLTAEEKNEFGDLFIARKRGTFGDLPVYRIGGDNTEFFNKVWIRYAMYDMTPQLKDKIFNYVRTLRMR